MIRIAICPVCQRPLNLEDESAAKHQPFCSERCRQVDLIRWFDGKYAIVEELQPPAFPSLEDEEFDR